MNRRVKEAAHSVEKTTALIGISTARIEEIASKNGTAAKLKRKLKRKKVK
jgi:hypothetical protein